MKSSFLACLALTLSLALPLTVPPSAVTAANEACPAPVVPLPDRLRAVDLAPGVRMAVYPVRHAAPPVGTPSRAFISVVHVRHGSASVSPATLGVPRLIHPQESMATRRTIAVMNGDYFDTMRQGDAVPQGALVVNGRALFAPSGISRVVITDARGRLRAARVQVVGSVVSSSGGILRPGAINDPLAPADVTVAFTPDWSRTQVPDGRQAVVVKGGRVLRHVPEGESASVPRNGLVIWLAKGDVLAGFEVGSEVEVDMGVEPLDGGEISSASGHGGVFLEKGRVVTACSLYENALRPRTFLAWNDNGDIWLLTASTRLPDPQDGVRRGGATKTQMAQVAKELGASHAVTLDGGGSTSLYARIGAKATRIDLPSSEWTRPLPVLWTVRVPRPA